MSSNWQQEAKFLDPSSWSYSENSLLTWAVSWGATGLLSHIPRGWLGGHHHKPEIIIVCASQEQSLDTKQGKLQS